ncbi:hypothetical protein [Eisenibacter elegans]|uniref:hypothetical protein n=1 Tax=Eisenibacter elegans TaxID=997 RepID=UPI000416CCCA|nr:hypothetical protein [Eisenibacter elegans]
MKKILFTLTFLCLFVGAQAQDFKPFKLGLGADYAISNDEDAKGGLLVHTTGNF